MKPLLLALFLFALSSPAFSQADKALSQNFTQMLEGHPQGTYLVRMTAYYRFPVTSGTEGMKVPLFTSPVISAQNPEDFRACKDDSQSFVCIANAKIQNFIETYRPYQGEIIADLDVFSEESSPVVSRKDVVIQNL